MSKIGLNPDACASYSLADRFTCRKCGVTPGVVRANNNQGQLSVTLSCHGEQTTWSGEKAQLTFIQDVFEAPDEV